ncbi:hypothetical protein COU18_02530 [Candidatus Kaiserbacteria bacterium CG10_big_fil_rev_8_21_14_0_10_51_14]|uniref:DUF4258 domain-containing protein n=1 Tax=Candidatus Kaiserbacteria bacterium CG10_big_fil_rev_8_21_14_0_10_51_14 TaxID=1974610 RepID=A0A2H0UAU8_9BACT|nr:MAG: hypothetical protein COU18_02530 [Candidatus Kaiserbacteria bacterium CG10_big_fil_rev_8_21_14_0_10_51_14]
MKIVFTDHAKRRLRERGLKEKRVREFVRSADSIEVSNKNPKRFLVKRRYFSDTFKKPRLLIVICEHERGVMVVVTVIDTSKIEKYS